MYYYVKLLFIFTFKTPFLFFKNKFSQYYTYIDITTSGYILQMNIPKLSCTELIKNY